MDRDVCREKGACICSPEAAKTCTGAGYWEQRFHEAGRRAIAAAVVAELRKPHPTVESAIHAIKRLAAPAPAKSDPAAAFAELAESVEEWIECGFIVPGDGWLDELRARHGLEVALQTPPARTAAQERTDWLVAAMGHSGELVLWWGPDRAGYTTELARAGRYTEAEARSIERSLSGTSRGDTAIPLDAAERLASQVVSADSIRGSEHGVPRG